MIYIDLTKDSDEQKVARLTRKLADAQNNLRLLRKLTNRNIDRVEDLEAENDRLRDHARRFAN